MTLVRTYQGSVSWSEYRRLLHERFGITFSTEPAESWIPLDGHQIHVDEWTPTTVARGTVILVHGAGGNGRILAPFGQAIAQMGWRALAPDLPGFGLTRTRPGFAADYSAWPQTIASIADAETGLVVLVGASVGGMTAVHAAQASSNVAGVVATTLLDMSDPDVFIAAAKTRLLGRFSLWAFTRVPRLVDRVSLPLRMVAPLQMMSSDPEMNAYFLGDPLIGTSRHSLRLFRTLHAFAPDTLNPRCPVLLVHPGQDTWTPPELSRKALARLPEPTSFHPLSQGSHLPVEEPARTELAAAIRAFLAGVEARGAERG